MSCFLFSTFSYDYNAHPLRRKDDVDLEGEFEPSLLNSAVYLLQLIQQISTFAINYQGRPFRESIRENRGMFWGLVLVSGVAFSCSTEFVPEINEKMRLVPFSTEFKVMMTGVMVLDYAGCWLIETVLKWAFSDFRPKDIAIRRPDQLERERKRREIEDAVAAELKEKQDDEKREAMRQKILAKQIKIPGVPPATSIPNGGGQGGSRLR